VVAFCLLLGVSALLNIRLASEVKQLKASIVALKTDRRLQPGTKVAALDAKDLEGRASSVRVQAVGLPTIVYVFTPQCGWCKRNEANLRALVQQTAGRYRVIALSLTDKDLAAYAKALPAGVPVYREPSEGTRATLKLGGTPHTIVLAATGVVEASWVGAFQGASKGEIEKVLSIRLPGLGGA
jgi:hypothetical protein